MRKRQRLGGIWVVLLLAFSVGACDKLSTKTEQQYLQQAKDAQQKGELQTSVIALKNALQKNPNNAESRMLLGELYIQLGQGGDAEKELRRAGELGASAESLKVPLGRAMLLMGEHRKLLDEIHASDQTSDLNRSKIHNLYGDAYMALRQPHESCEHFQRALMLDRSYPEVYWGMARCALTKGDLAGTRQHLEAALSLGQANPGTWIRLGELARMQDRHDQALQAFENALKFAPGALVARTRLIESLIHKNDLKRAADELAKIRQQYPKNLEAKYLQALLDYREKNYVAARDKLQEILRVAPDESRTMLLYGAVNYETGAFEQAEQYLARYLARFPNNVVARRLLAVSLLRLNRFQQALEVIQPLSDQGEDDLGALAIAGEAAMRLGNFARAMKYLDRAAQLDPQSAGIKTLHAASQIASGEWDAGVRSLEQAALADSGHHQADLMLVMAHSRRGEFDKAFQAVEKLEKSLPKNPITHYLRGMVYLGKKDTANARKSLEAALAIEPTYISAAAILGRLDFEDKKPDAAKKRFEKILDNDRKNIQAMLALAEIAAYQKEDAEMLSWLERAAKTNPKALQPRMLMARYYLLKRTPAKALTVAREAQTANPGSVQAMDLLGSTQLAAGETENALATFTKLNEMRPNLVPVMVRLAEVQLAVGRGPEAKKTLEKALTLAPNEANALLMLSSLESRAGNADAALNLARRLQAQQPQSPVGFVTEGDILSANKQYAPALKAYEKAYALNQTGDTAVKLHWTRVQMGNSQEADNQLLKWLAQYPEDDARRIYLAESYQLRQRDKAAIGQYEILIKRNPKQVVALNNLANIYAVNKDPRALDLAKKAYQLAPQSAAVLDTYGWILLQGGAANQALPHLKQALALAPNNPSVKYHYAMALAQTGSQGQARKELEALLQSQATFPEREAASRLLATL